MLQAEAETQQNSQEAQHTAANSRPRAERKEWRACFGALKENVRVFSRQSLNGLRLVRPSPVNPTRITLRKYMGPFRHAYTMGRGSGMCGTYGPKTKQQKRTLPTHNPRAAVGVAQLTLGDTLGDHYPGRDKGASTTHVTRNEDLFPVCVPYTDHFEEGEHRRGGCLYAERTL
jgi:hypothetical protein